MSKRSFKDIHTDLTDYMAGRKEYPVVSFEDTESIPRQLRGKMFMFAAHTGKDQKKKTQLGIMVLEQKGIVQEPVCALTALDKAKDRRFRVQYQGKLLLLDEEVNLLLAQLGNRLQTYKLTKSFTPGEQDGKPTVQ